MISLQDIHNIFHGAIKLGEPIAPYTVIGVGGPADYLLEASSNQESERVIHYLRHNGFPHLILRSQMLVSDKGFRGAAVVVKEVSGKGSPIRSATMFKSPANLSAAELIEKVGVNGVFLGGAEVQGNSVVNVNNATASDVLALVRHIQAIIKRECGIPLEIELELIGFDEENLAKVA